ncbi:MAG: superinfection immunity protein [Robiginitomaculum sp.]|jgi:Superinfection immunity protein|nr:superinfection immunity protein [Robiginitomaculum sp.]MDQ7078335.1 superinfection immunity protein [Robiginitomaculum sp.]PHS23590.1 MAG: superinfection immunity protein [Robiginitomaculum sp.]
MEFALVPLLLYFLPWIIALIRGHHNAGAIFLLNVLLGWTFIGWIVAFIWSFTSIRRYYV